MIESLKQRLRRLYKKVQAKGHERISFMIIPHNESHILNLQLSKFTIAFAFIVFLVVVLTSFLSVRLQVDIQTEASELYDKDRAFINEREQYIRKYVQLSESQTELKNGIQRLYRQLEISDSDNFMFLDDEILREQARAQINYESRQFVENMNNLQGEDANLNLNNLQEKLLAEFKKAEIPDDFQYHPEVVSYRKLKLDMKQTIDALKALNTFLAERLAVQKSLPYFWPVAGGHFTSFYGSRISPFGYSRDFHSGIDLADAIGTPIYSSADGYVYSAGYNGGYGKTVRIQHKYGFKTLYAHMSTIAVRSGTYVKKGQFIGRIGATGRVTGPHLHYEIRINDRHVDPLPYLSSL